MSSSNLIRWGALAAVLAGVTFVVEAVIHLLNPAEVGDHSSSVGFLSEALFAAALLFVIGALVGVHIRQTGSYGRLGKLGFFVTFTGLALTLPQLAFVLLTGSEPPEWLVVPAVLAALVGLMLLGIATLRARVLPLWSAPALIAFLPIIFFGGYVGGFLAGLIWIALGYALWSSSNSSVRQTVHP